MFKLFGKKKEREEKPLTGEELQVQTFAQQFQPEEWDIVVVTAPVGVDRKRKDGESLWVATVPLSAWMDEDDGIVHREEARLTMLADDRLYSYLRQSTPRNFILKCRVRPALETGLFQLVDLPEPGFDPELKAILDEQLRPVTFEDEQLGQFTLNREMGWFAANVDWCGAQALLTVDEKEDREQALAAARAVMDRRQDWDDRVRAFAADRLLDRANELACENGAEQSVTREDFTREMELSSLQVYADGGVDFWFEDGGLFWGRSVHISGTVGEGPAEAQMEG